MATKEIKALLDELRMDLVRISDNELSDEVKDTYRKEIEYMYTEYEPYVYERRYENFGFMDEANWELISDFNRAGVNITLTNETEAVNPLAKYRLDVMIEKGIYDFKKSPPPRPVYERTMDRIITENVVENTLEYELKKKGWELE